MSIGSGQGLVETILAQIGGWQRLRHWLLVTRNVKRRYRRCSCTEISSTLSHLERVCGEIAA
jgi:hypothetical protein